MVIMGAPDDSLAAPYLWLEHYAATHQDRNTDRQTDRRTRQREPPTKTPTRAAKKKTKKKRQELAVALVNEKVRTNGLKKKSVSRMKKH